MARKKFSTLEEGPGARNGQKTKQDIAPTTTADKIKQRKIKKELRDKRNINRQRDAVLPLKLNKRLLKIQRAAELNALNDSDIEDDLRPVQENLSCNWSILKENMDADRVLSIGLKKKRRRQSCSSSTAADPKRIRKSSESDASSSADEDSFQSCEEEQHDVVDTNAIIDGIAEQNKITGKKGCPEVAWFDNVDPFLLEDDVVMPENEQVEVDMDGVDNFFDKVTSKIETTKNRIADAKRAKLLENVVAMDCEMVGVGEGGVDSSLARVSIVDKFGKTVYDNYSKPEAKVTDYRTRYSGIRPENLVNAPAFAQVQREVAALLKGKLLVGHALKNDLSALLLSHPAHCIRDTSTYGPFRTRYNNYSPSLKNLCRDFLGGVVIQDGEHDSVVDARAAMRLYATHREQWEDNYKRLSHNGLRKATMINAKRIRGRHGGRRRKPKKNKQFASRSVSKKR